MKRARLTEIKVAQEYIDKNYCFLYHNKKIFGVEMDLIFLDPASNIIFIEVKSLSQSGLIEGRLPKKQEARLLKAKLFFESIYSLPVEVRLALVSLDTRQVFDFVIL